MDIKEELEYILNESFEFVGYMGVIEQNIRGHMAQCTRTKCHKSAGGTSNPFKKEGRRCAHLCWAEAYQKAIISLNAGKSRCKTAKNPDKCIARFNKTIDAYKGFVEKHKKKASDRMK
jgi:hypothetical protein